MLKLIVCYDEAKGIAKDNKIPWHNDQEMQHFKNTTINHTIVMGRKTYESMNKLLKNRNNIIFSNDKNLKIDDAKITNDVSYIIDLSKKEDVFIIGGKQIYKLFEPYYDELIISEIKGSYNCDLFFNLNLNLFYLVNEQNYDDFVVKTYKSYKNKIMFGSLCQEHWKKELTIKKEQLVNKYKQEMTLAIIQVGNDFASSVYIRNKQNLGNKLGINVKVFNYDENIQESELITNINKLNNDGSVHGILVQMPLANHLNKNHIINAIDPKKDVDGFNPINVGKLWTNNFNNLLISCTPHGIIKLLEFNKVEMKGKNVVIIGRSETVSKPLISLFLAQDATVQVCHSKTVDLKQKTQLADILVVAIGKANFIKADYIKQDAIIVDVGINRLDSQIVGDVDFKDVIDKVKLISPVPGGVGLMTLIMLFYNLLICYENCNHKN